MNSNFGDPPKKFSFSVVVKPHQNSAGSCTKANANVSPPPPSSTPPPSSSLDHPTQRGSLASTNTQQPLPYNTSSSGGGGYGGGLIRISELRQQNVNIHSGLRVVPPNVPLPRAELDRAPAMTSAPFGQSGGTASGSGGVTTVPDIGTVFYERESRRAPPGRTASRAARRGARGGGAGGGSGATLPLQPDGSLCEYRWYTKGRRRVLLYDGQSYTGTRAHKMWKSIVARGGGSSSSSSSSASTRKAATASRRVPRQRKARKAKKSTRIRGRRAPAAPSRTQLLNRPTTLEVSDDQPWATPWQSAPGVAVTHVVPPPLPVSAAAPPRTASRRATAAVLLSQALPPASQSLPARSQTSVVIEVTDSDEEGQQTARPLTRVKKEPIAGTASAAPSPWPTSYFPEDDLQCSSSGSTRDGSRSRGSPSTADDDEPDGHDRHADSNGFRLAQVGGVTVVEKGGWLYSQEVIQEMCSQLPAPTTLCAPAEQRKDEDLPIWERFERGHYEAPPPPAPTRGGGAWHTPQSSREGIQVVGQVVPAHSVAATARVGVHRHPRVAGVGPQFARYEEGNAWDAMSPEEVEGFFENGDEQGGVRYASM